MLLHRWRELLVCAFLFYFVPMWNLFPFLVIYTLIRHEDELEPDPPI